MEKNMYQQSVSSSHKQSPSQESLQGVVWGSSLSLPPWLPHPSLEALAAQPSSEACPYASSPSALHSQHRYHCYCLLLTLLLSLPCPQLVSPPAAALAADPAQRYYCSPSLFPPPADSVAVLPSVTGLAHYPLVLLPLLLLLMVVVLPAAQHQYPPLSFSAHSTHSTPAVAAALAAGAIATSATVTAAAQTLPPLLPFSPAAAVVVVTVAVPKADAPHAHHLPLLLA
jgi:hypothetical protein